MKAIISGLARVSGKCWDILNSSETFISQLCRDLLCTSAQTGDSCL